ncbi:MAG: pyridoxine 5'-phosphate synthase [Candidatus Omnitrophota bacterium]|nr:pyridoxine 5'-phosphate synthase [Candidatus Omnitrophota bacterium]
MPLLGVNIDHVATLRQARGGREPDPIQAAGIVEQAGAKAIVVHLREDRRHINEGDVWSLRKTVTTKLNLEMSIAPEIVNIAVQIKPDQTTLVPEKREELTTEGGLDVVSRQQAVREVVLRLKKEGIKVSLFIDPVNVQIEAAKRTGANLIELHTGDFANAPDEITQDRQLTKLIKAKDLAVDKGLIVTAGHGLNYQNVKKVAGIDAVEELNIGYSIISRAVFVGLDRAVKEMLELI